MSSEQVRIGPISENRALLLPVEVVNGAVDLVEWIVEQRASAAEWLDSPLAILFRGFRLPNEDSFQSFVDQVSGGRVEYMYRSTPRTTVGDRVYTATEYPAKYAIPMHNENAYQRDWPMRLMFYCVVPAQRGGETPLADTAKVTQRISPVTRRTFAERGVLYVRNYGKGVDIPWQTVFQTEDRARVESYCRTSGIEWEWKPDDGLRTRQVCQGTAIHPRTGEELWFNQAHLFHVSSLGEDAKASLAAFGEEHLPRNAYYGDGAPLEEEVLAEIRDAFQTEAVSFPWRANDVLLLDNMRVSHGRNPYSGPRRVLASMADPYSVERARIQRIDRPSLSSLPAHSTR
jgi:alpha-ketoglutarate-dependent taurine dioxygenase